MQVLRLSDVLALDELQALHYVLSGYEQVINLVWQVLNNGTVYPGRSSQCYFGHWLACKSPGCQSPGLEVISTRERSIMCHKAE